MKYLPLFILLFTLSAPAATKKKLRILVPDTGVDASIAAIRKYISPRYLETEHARDRHGHGTHVIGIILEHACPGVEILPCAYYRNNGDGAENLNRLVSCLRTGIAEKVDVINVSGGGNQPSVAEKRAVEDFCSRKGTTFISSAGNDGGSADEYFPVGYRLPCQVGVGSTDKEGKRLASSNDAPWLVWELGLRVESYLPGGKRGTMSGTSQATAIRTGRIVKEFCSKNR